jgi:uncharacterized membrane protein (UPF0136 family)
MDITQIDGSNQGQLVLWVYIVLLVAGGAMGFIKAKSKPSLIASTVFAAALALCALGVIKGVHTADWLMLALLGVFGMRLAKTKKFMPAGLMLVVTAVALALRNISF